MATIAFSGVPAGPSHPVVPRDIAKKQLWQLCVGTGAMIQDALLCYEDHVSVHPASVRAVLERIHAGSHISAYVAARVEAWLSTPRMHPPGHSIMRDYAWPEILAPGLHVRIHKDEADLTTERRKAFRRQDPAFFNMPDLPTFCEITWDLDPNRRFLRSITLSAAFGPAYLWDPIDIPVDAAIRQYWQWRRRGVPWFDFPVPAATSATPLFPLPDVRPKPEADEDFGT